MGKGKSKGFFDIPEWWEEHWQGMPEFRNKDQAPFKTIIVYFKNSKDALKFGKLVEQTITDLTQSIWYPKVKIRRYVNKCYIDKDNNES